MAGLDRFFSNRDEFLSMYWALSNGRECAPRGQKILEVEDYQLDLDASLSCLTSFKARNLNLSYAIREFLWYLAADKYDTTIEKYASIWPKIKQPEGFYYSNYGQYMFGEQGGIPWVIAELTRDKDSRRAAFPFLRAEHCFESNRDMVCTYSMGFRIRDNKLNMSINMRSNDAIFGTTNDVFAFWMTQKIVLAFLLRHYPELSLGSYRHKVDSLHVYERHWEMLTNILADAEDGYQGIHVPAMTRDEILGMMAEPYSFKVRGEFTKWIMANYQKG